MAARGRSAGVGTLARRVQVDVAEVQVVDHRQAEGCDARNLVAAVHGRDPRHALGIGPMLCREPQRGFVGHRRLVGGVLRPHRLFERDQGAPVNVSEPIDIDLRDFDVVHVPPGSRPQ